MRLLLSLCLLCRMFLAGAAFNPLWIAGTESQNREWWSYRPSTYCGLCFEEARNKTDRVGIDWSDLFSFLGLPVPQRPSREAGIEPHREPHPSNFVAEYEFVGNIHDPPRNAIIADSNPKPDSIKRFRIYNNSVKPLWKFPRTGGGELFQYYLQCCFKLFSESIRETSKI